MSPHHHSAPPTDQDAIESRDAGLGASLGRIVRILGRKELAKWRPIMALALILTMVAKGLAVVSPVFIGDAVNELGTTDAVAASVGLLLAWWIGSRILSMNLPYLRDALFAPISQDAQRMMAVDAYGHAQRLSLAFHQTRRTGALNRVIDRGVGALDFLIRFLGFNIGPTIIELTLAAGVLAIRYSPLAALTAIVTVVTYAFFTGYITNLRVAQRREMNAADTELRARAVDSLTNFETVKAFAAEERETQIYDNSMRVYNTHAVKVSRSLALLNAGQEILMSLGLGIVAALTAWAVLSGRALPGDVMAVVLIMGNLYRPLNILGWAFREIKQGAVDLEKLYGLMEMEPEVKDAPDAKPLNVVGGAVKFEDVTFSHEARSSGLESVSFEAPAGAKIAIVGPSGSGKSTLLKLLFRFYDTDGGRVIVDGQDVRDVTQVSLREAIGLVPQDVVLFNTTLKENLIYGKPDATEEEARDAARKARLLDFIDALPNGWETRVGERGVKLSGGEKQRLGIARAILKDPAILVLDEATSALDSVTEMEVQAALDEASKGRTTLMVAHRLSTVSSADEILVLDQGQIVERGNHADLLAKDGIYADLWTRQARSGETDPTAADAVSAQ